MLATPLSRSRDGRARDEVDEQHPDVRVLEQVAHRQVHAVAVVVRERDRVLVEHADEAGVAALVRALRPAVGVGGGEEEHVHPLDERAVVVVDHRRARGTSRRGGRRAGACRSGPAGCASRRGRAELTRVGSVQVGQSRAREHVLAAVVPDGVEPALGVQAAAQIAVGDRRSPPRRTAVRRSPRPEVGSITAAPPRPNTSLSGRQRHREVVGERRGRDELRHRHDERARLDRDVAHRREPAVAVVGRRRDPDLRAAAVDARSGPAASGSPSRSGRRPARRRRSTTARSSPAPIPWKSRSCWVGISLRWRAEQP